ncbi:MAG: DegV family protein [Firmicutes bacterium]|nr:DegV family protein [Bacillota bacterium]
MKFVLSTDTSCDIPREELKQLNISYIPLTYIINGQSFEDNFSTDEEFKGFYKLLRGGAIPKTSQINTQEHYDYFKSMIENGAKNILHITLSGALSATYSAACIAAQQLMQEFDGTKIVIVDSRSSTYAVGFLVYQAKEFLDNGKDVDETAEVLNKTRTRLYVLAMTDDLSYVRRGGRISLAKAFIGTLLKIKPVFSIDRQGALSVINKVKGTKSVFAYYVEQFKKLGIDPENQKFYISHGDSGAAADELIEYLRENGFKGDVKKGFIGPVIGSHTGIGALILVFEANQERPE